MTSLKNASSLDGNARAAALASWPKHLRTPTELLEALKRSWSYLLVHVLNKTRVYNGQVFNRELRRLEEQNHHAILSSDHHPGSHRPRDLEHQKYKSPLLTLSNHISCIDDPVLWATLLPFWYYFTKNDTVRWSAAATDICFTKPWHSTFFSLGKTFPIVRGAGLEQPAMDFARALLRHNQWLHLFPEGRVMRNDNQEMISNRDRGYIFKWGVSKLILDYFRRGGDIRPDSEIRILPFYHLGMDKVLPIGWPYFPRFNKKITVYMNPSVIKMNPRELSHILATRELPFTAAKSRSDDEIARIKLTNYLEDQVESLIDQATRYHLAS